MSYTTDDQRADRAFLVGVNYGRSVEGQRIADILRAKSLTAHGPKCLCLVCAAFEECAQSATDHAPTPTDARHEGDDR